MDPPPRHAPASGASETIKMDLLPARRHKSALPYAKTVIDSGAGTRIGPGPMPLEVGSAKGRHRCPARTPKIMFRVLRPERTGANARTSVRGKTLRLGEILPKMNRRHLMPVTIIEF